MTESIISKLRVKGMRQYTSSVVLAARRRASLTKLFGFAVAKVLIDGRFVTPAEVYPNSEAWGVDGFTVSHKDAAFAKLRELA